MGAAPTYSTISSNAFCATLHLNMNILVVLVINYLELIEREKHKMFVVAENVVGIKNDLLE